MEDFEKRALEQVTMTLSSPGHMDERSWKDFCTTETDKDNHHPLLDIYIYKTLDG
jgi:hypothetical protein